MRLAGSTIIAIILTATISLCTAEDSRESKVRIHATDTFGNELTPIRVVRFVEQRINGKDFSSQFVDAQAHGVPYGNYVISVNAGNIRLGRIVHIDSPEVFLVLSGSGTFIDYGPHPLPGPINRVVGLPKDAKAPIWVKIASLFGNEPTHWTLRVGNDGSFSALGGLDIGQYALVVLNRRGILFSGNLSLKERESKIEVDVSAGTIKQSH